MYICSIQSRFFTQFLIKLLKNQCLKVMKTWPQALHQRVLRHEARKATEFLLCKYPADEILLWKYTADENSLYTINQYYIGFMLLLTGNFWYFTG